MGVLVGEVWVSNKASQGWNQYEFENEWSVDGPQQFLIWIPKDLAWNPTEKCWFVSDDVPVIFAQIYYLLKLCFEIILLSLVAFNKICYINSSDVFRNAAQFVF